MEDPVAKRNKKKDKSKEKFEKTGGYTKKHIRIMEKRKTS